MTEQAEQVEQIRVIDENRYGPEDDQDPTSVIESTTAPQQGPQPVVHPPTSTYQPTTGPDPYGYQGYKAEMKRKLVQLELGDRIKVDDTELLDKFFPPSPERESRGQDILNALGNMYGTTTRYSALGDTRRKRETLDKGWIDIPSPPLANQPTILEKNIATPFVKILNSIIAYLDLETTRVAIDRQQREISTHDGGTLKPDIFLAAVGSEPFSAFPPTAEIPLYEVENQGNRLKPSDVPPAPPVNWKWCVIPIELKTEKQRGGVNNREVIYQLGTYNREVLLAQSNRRFMPSLIVTESTVEFLIWDRTGVVASRRLDYHKYPAVFCDMFASIIQWDDQQLGFDPSIIYDHGVLKIRTQQSIDYVVEAVLFRPYNLIGRGTTSWRVHKSDETDDHYIITDSWVLGGVAVEGSVSQKVQSAMNEHGLDSGGSASFVHTEDVQFMRDRVVLTDTIHHIRQTDTNEFEEAIPNLVHTRTVSSCLSNCQRLENFSTVKELVVGLSDVVKALRRMYMLAGVLHRDVTIWNILLQPDALEGSRGRLIDFSSSSSTVASSDSSHPQSANLFRSRKSLVNGIANSHLDDLESVYYTLCFIVAGHSGTNLANSRLKPMPYAVRLWETGTQEDNQMTKHGHIVEDFMLPVQPFFGGAVEQLAKRLHGFFRKRQKAQSAANSRGMVLPPPDPSADYREFERIFATAITELDNPAPGKRSSLKRSPNLPALKSNKKLRMATTIFTCSDDKDGRDLDEEMLATYPYERSESEKTEPVSERKPVSGWTLSMSSISCGDSESGSQPRA